MGFRVLIVAQTIKMVEDHLEKNIEHEMETRYVWGLSEVRDEDLGLKL